MFPEMLKFSGPEQYGEVGKHLLMIVEKVKILHLLLLWFFGVDVSTSSGSKTTSNL